MTYTNELELIIGHIKTYNLMPCDIMTLNDFCKLNITQDILDDAYSKMDIVVEKVNNILFEFKDLYKIETRKCKKIERINKKINKIKSDNNFKINSDFIGIRIKCNITNIYKLIAKLKNNFDLFFERNSILSDGIYKDIITYCYAYDSNTKYLIEFQIGHPFAMYVFTRDSYIRDNPNTNIIDLWSNNFYLNVVNKIIHKFDYDILDNLNKIYNNKNIEQDLLDILMEEKLI
jgi:hypothetical protein